MGGWFRKEINTVDDLKGLKFRIGGFAGRVMQKLGCVPQQLAGGDIYPALEKGTIDAAEWVGPYDDEKLGLYKVAPHYYYPGMVGRRPDAARHGQSRQVECAAEILSERARAGRSLRQQLDDGEIRHRQSDGAASKLLAGGTKLHAFSPPIMEASFKAAKELHTEVAATNANFKKVYDSMTAFSNNGYQWFQVAEVGYDNFMARHSQG